jgi:glycosyltransferase involved in cell wall biosynthesis
MSSPHLPASHLSLLNFPNKIVPFEGKSLRDSARKPDTRLNDLAMFMPIIAICHLSWEWVWQRPQQFLSRLAKTHPLLFVETHRTETPDGYVSLRSAANTPGVTIAEMHLPACHWHDGNFIDLTRRRLLQQVLEKDLHGTFDNAILWMNDPMAVTAFAGELGESMLVYDCMDELSQFAGAPPGLIDRERELTQRADVIFCGGRKMRDKRLPLNPNTHFYGTGVDCRHFGHAMEPNLKVHPDLAKLPGPILGYFGVIDERIDYELLTQLADSNPNWSIAMVGPFAKVDPDSLPQRPNLHWLGGKAYSELPALTKGFDVCLMPFAINAATEFINPTKALEYMAAGKPVVATALDEVKTNFSVAAHIATNHEEFISLCRSECASPSKQRIKLGLKLASDNTWEAIVSKMDGHLQDVLTARQPTRSAPAKSLSIPILATGNPRAYV